MAKCKITILIVQIMLLITHICLKNNVLLAPILMLTIVILRMDAWIMDSVNRQLEKKRNK